MPGIPTDSVWEFFSHTAYYNQRAQWVEEVVEGDRHGEVPMKQPQLTRVSNMSGLVDACSLKEFLIQLGAVYSSDDILSF